MVGYGRPADHNCTLEPIWISLEEEVSPLLWRPYGTELPPPLEIPMQTTKAADIVTVVMERSHQYVNILTAHPPEAFDGNELSLKMAETAAESLRVMVIQNERGKDTIAVAFFLLGSELCLACIQISAQEEARDVYSRILTQSTTLIGFLSIPFDSPVESWMYHGGFFTCLECVNVELLNYLFTIGPGERDKGYQTGNVCSERVTQINVSFTVSPDFYKLERKGDSDQEWVFMNLLRHSSPEIEPEGPRKIKVVDNIALDYGIQINTDSIWETFKQSKFY